MAAKVSKQAPESVQMEFEFSRATAPLERTSREPLASPFTHEPELRPSPRVEARGESAQKLADALRADLCGKTGLDVRLRITNNSSTMMSLRYDAAGGVNVGLHHMFLEAPEEIQKALAGWVLRPRAKVPGKKLEGFIAQKRHLIKSRTAKRAVLRTDGAYFDLSALYQEVNAEEFAGEVTSPITWGKMPAAGRRRSIRFGSYSPGEDLIRIHPLLDQAFVPPFFVRYIVFHEMLHAHMGIEESESGRRKIHPPAFKKREAAYGDFERALRWMDDGKNLKRLLRAPRG